MKLGKPLDFTFMRHLHKVHYANDATDEKDIHFFMSQFKKFGGLLDFIAPSLLVIDYSKRSYPFWSNSGEPLLGYDVNEMLEGGLDMIIPTIQTDFFKCFNEHVFPATLSFLKNTPQCEHSDYVFSFNNRMKDTQGRWREVYQRCRYITSPESGLPVFCLSVGMDITEFKKDNILRQTIERIIPGNTLTEVIETNYFYPFEEDTLLSKHEKNILSFMAEGLSSKMIAHKLGISENTISNHRQNMLRKTNTKNVAQLVAFAIRGQII